MYVCVCVCVCVYIYILFMFEKNGESETNIAIKGGWKSLVGNKSYRNIAGSQRLGEIREVELLSTLVEGIDLSSASRGLSNLREGCTPGQH